MRRRLVSLRPLPLQARPLCSSAARAASQSLGQPSRREIRLTYLCFVGSFPDGQSALNLAAARLRHIAGTAWSAKRYLNIEMLKDQQMRGAINA